MNLEDADEGSKIIYTVVLCSIGSHTPVIEGIPSHVLFIWEKQKPLVRSILLALQCLWVCAHRLLRARSRICSEMAQSTWTPSFLNMMRSTLESWR